MESIDVRLARTDDFAFVRELHREIGRLHAQAEPTIFIDEETTTEEEFARMVDCGSLLIADFDGRPVGMCACAVCTPRNVPGMRVRKILRIDGLGVVASYKRRGVGRALYEAALAKARAEEYEVVDLNVWAFNEAAAAFYESLGMRRVSHRFQQEV